jgi:hypothetical protein
LEHIVLLGDSIFDNSRYIGGEPDVVSRLRSLIPPGWKATLCAVDGSVAKDLRGQVTEIPAGATRLVVSAGGNDALAHLHLLEDRALPGLQLLKELSTAADNFERAYRTTIGGVSRLGKWLMVCTIYNGNLDPQIAAAARAAVSVFNDRIYRVAGELGLPVLELRGICTEPSDYANPIEPSGKGGGKIATAILDRIRSAAAG